MWLSYLLHKTTTVCRFETQVEGYAAWVPTRRQVLQLPPCWRTGFHLFALLLFSFRTAKWKQSLLQGNQTINLEGFRVFLFEYFGVELPIDLVDHLFHSFSKPPVKGIAVNSARATHESAVSQNSGLTPAAVLSFEMRRRKTEMSRYSKSFTWISCHARARHRVMHRIYGCRTLRSRYMFSLQNVERVFWKRHYQRFERNLQIIFQNSRDWLSARTRPRWTRYPKKVSASPHWVVLPL